MAGAEEEEEKERNEVGNQEKRKPKVQKDRELVVRTTRRIANSEVKGNCNEQDWRLTG